MNDHDETAPADATPDQPGGAGIVRANLFVTLAFAAVSVPLALLDRKALIIVVVALSLVIFAAGIAAFIASFARAAERSRTEEVGVANLYLLTGPTAPRSIRVVMTVCVAVQISVAVAVAVIGISGDAWSDENRNPMAFATLTPMFGLGMNGLWAASFGAFGPRVLKPKR